MGNLRNDATVIFRSGIVTSVDEKKATVRAKFPDLKKPDGEPLVSFDMQVVRSRAFGDREYWMPDIDEQVFCVFLGNGIERGFVLGGIYSTEDPPPVTDRNKHHIVYRDDSYWEYDRKEHKLSLRISGKSLENDENETNGGAERARSGDANGDGEGERGGKVDVFVEETIDIYAKGNITVKTDADILIQAEGKMDVIVKKDVTVKTEANVIVEAGGDVKVKAGGAIDMNADGEINIKASGNVNIKGSKINLN